MKKLVCLTAVASIFTCTAAMADTSRYIDVEISYDAEMLETDTGADAVMASIQQQAEDACTIVTPRGIAGLLSPRRDRTCVNDVIDNAVSAIKAQESQNGNSVSQQFAQLTQ